VEEIDSEAVFEIEKVSDLKNEAAIV